MCQDIQVKTTVDINRELSDAAAELLGTSTLKETVNAAFEEVIRARGRAELSRALRGGELPLPSLEDLARAKAADEGQLAPGALDWLLGSE